MKLAKQYSMVRFWQLAAAIFSLNLNKSWRLVRLVEIFADLNVKMYNDDYEQVNIVSLQLLILISAVKFP